MLPGSRRWSSFAADPMKSASMACECTRTRTCERRWIPTELVFSRDFRITYSLRTFKCELFFHFVATTKQTNCDFKICEQPTTF